MLIPDASRSARYTHRSCNCNKVAHKCIRCRIVVGKWHSKTPTTASALVSCWWLYEPCRAQVYRIKARTRKPTTSQGVASKLLACGKDPLFSCALGVLNSNILTPAFTALRTNVARPLVVSLAAGSDVRTTGPSVGVRAHTFCRNSNDWVSRCV
eukprot:9074226-Heterocapsa_arctica.AAC.1